MGNSLAFFPNCWQFQQSYSGELYPERYLLSCQVSSQHLKDTFSIPADLQAVPTQGVNIDPCREYCAGSKICLEKHQQIRLSFP